SIHETTLYIAARAMIDGNTLFLIELSYAGIFQLTGIPPERLETVLMIDCPFVLFPFARRVIADVTRDGGFPPLLLDPVDFQAIHLQKKRAVQAATGKKKPSTEKIFLPAAGSPKISIDLSIFLN